jgi:hypothetical protein
MLKPHELYAIGSMVCWLFSDNIVFPLETIAATTRIPTKAQLDIEWLKTNSWEVTTPAGLSPPAKETMLC